MTEGDVKPDRILRFKVVDVFHHHDGTSATNGLRFYSGTDDANDTFEINVEKCTVREKAVGEERIDTAVLPPPEYHVDVCNNNTAVGLDTGLHRDIDEDFEYPASMTQATSQEQSAPHLPPVMPLQPRNGGESRVYAQNPVAQSPKQTVGPREIQKQEMQMEGNVPLFTTGAGSKIVISKDKIDAAAKLLADTEPVRRTDQAPEINSSIFTTGAGTHIPIPKDKIDAAARLLSDHGEVLKNTKSNPSSSLFTTGSGSKIAISKEKIDTATALLSNVDTPPLPSSKSKIANTPGVGAPKVSVSRFGPAAKSGRKSSLLPSTSHNTPAMKTPGHSLVGKRPRTSDLQTPRLVTPQVGFVGNSGYQDMTPGNSIQQQSVMRQNSIQIEQRETPDHLRTRLPATPELASKHYFEDMYGPGDVRAHLLALGAKPDVAKDSWTRNHYKWVVWKRALIELYLEKKRNVGSILNYGAVKEEIHGRYIKEYVEGKRSFLKGVFQRDVSFKVPSILKVAAIQSSPTESLCSIELTDGWYSIVCDVDREIMNLIAFRKIYVGKKLRIFGADLVGGTAGDPLDAFHNTRVNLRYNQVHPVDFTSKLGVVDTRIPIIPLSCINERGGVTTRSIVSVLRVFPSMMWTKLPSGVSTFQTSTSAAKAEASLDEEMEKMHTKVKDIIQNEEKAMCQKWLSDGKPGGLQRVERLYATFVISQSQGVETFEDSLTDDDKRALERFIAARMIELQSIQQQRCKDMIGAEVPSALGAKSIPCRTLLVGQVSSSPMFESVPMEYLPTDDARRNVALLTVWRPNDDVSRIQEGDLVSLTALDRFNRDVPSQIYRGEFFESLKHLQTTSVSSCTKLPKSMIPANQVLRCLVGPAGDRCFTSDTLLQHYRDNLAMPNIFGMNAVLIGSGPTYLAADHSHHFQWAFFADASQGGDDPQWIVGIQLKGPEDGVKWIQNSLGNIPCHIENVAVRSFDTSNHIIQMDGSMATSVVPLALHVPPLNILSKNTCLMDSLKERIRRLMQ